jgi:hypothetical protein
MWMFACFALFFETLECLSDLSKRRTRYLFDCWTFALRWRFADAKTTTCCVLSSVTTFVCRLFHSLHNFSSLNAWCFSKSSSFFESRFLLSRSKKTTSMTRLFVKILKTVTMWIQIYTYRSADWSMILQSSLLFFYITSISWRFESH